MIKQGNYYNSDLNEFIGKNLPKIMTSIDCDLLQVKKSKRIIRLAEYKHENEKMGFQQEEAFKHLANLAAFINKYPDHVEKWKLEVMLIRGNPPFDVIYVTDFITNETIKIEGKENVQKFLTLE